MNLLLSGWYGHRNAGDELLLDIFLERMQEHSITVLTDGDIDPARTKSVHHADLARFDIGGFRQWLNGQSVHVLSAILRTDAFILGGGGLLRENGNYRNLRRLLDEIHICSLLGKRTIVYGVSIGPINSQRGIEMIGRALRLCDFVTVRDESSKQWLQEFGLQPERCLLAPDPVFTITDMKLDRTFQDRSLLNRITTGSPIPIFLANGLADGDRNPGALPRLAAALDSLHTRQKISFITIPFQRSSGILYDDHDCALALRGLMRYPKAIECYDSSPTHNELVEIIDAIPFAICVRLHAMIISMARATPFVALNYDEKVSATAAMGDFQQSVVNVDEHLAEALVEHIEAAFRATVDHFVLKNKAAYLAHEANQTFQAIKNVLDE